MKRRNTGDRGRKYLKKYILISSVLTVLLLTGAFGVFFYNSNHADTELQYATEDYAEYEIESGAYENEEMAAVRDFIDRELPDYSTDKREVFRIIEVIPHEACSIFPYLIEWKTKEEYERNLPIGYEGLLLLAMDDSRANLFSNENVMAKKSYPFTRKGEAIKSDYLSYYVNAVGTKSSGKWYQQTSGVDAMPVEDGYFEFVGAGNGLYNLNLNTATEASNGQGIRYEVQALQRKNGNPQGELYVENAAFYWPSDQPAAAALSMQYKGTPIVTLTGYHYDLSFLVDLTGAQGTYRVDLANVKEKAANRSGEFDYFLEVSQPDDWANGFEYYLGGNYQVASADENNQTGEYIRISDDSRSDNYSNPTLNLDKGYFALYKDYQSTVPGNVPRYDVTFQSTSGTGYYAAVAHQAETAWESETEVYYFDYAGEGKGRYDISFLYTESSVYTRYTVKDELKVDNNSGRYALTAMTKDGLGNPIYKENDGSGKPCDYSKIVTNLSFTNSTAAAPGVTLGGAGTGNGGETGAWVFVPVSDPDDMELTKLKNIQGKTSFNLADRIYVRNQSRRHRYYARTGFVNNEWFKLLCYSSHPDDEDSAYSQTVNGVEGYKFGDTAVNNLNDPETKKLIEQFDNAFRIEIVQKTPSQLTPEDVKSAELIYISAREGINNLMKSWEWLSSERKKMGLDELPPLPAGTPSYANTIAFTDDFRADTLRAIYDECIYERNCALMTNYVSIGSNFSPSSTVEKNYQKLFIFMNYFKDAKDYAKFMEWYPDEYNPVYSKISTPASNSSDAFITPYMTPGNWGVYNEIEAPEGTSSTRGWNTAYFQVKDTNGGLLYGSKNGAFLEGNDGQKNIYKDETKYFAQEYTAGIFNDPDKSLNIWKILHNRKKDTGIIVVTINNGEVLANSEATRIIYADEFDPESFNIKYEISMVGGSGVKPPLTGVNVTYHNGTSDVSVDSHVNPEYDYEYETGAKPRIAFAQDANNPLTSLLNPNVTMQKFTITATATNGKSGSAEVWVIVREAFDLN